MAMTEGTLAEWLVADGQEVTEGQPIYVIETEKVAQEIEAPAAGRLVHKRPAFGLYEVGTEIGEIRPPARNDSPEAIVDLQGLSDRIAIRDLINRYSDAVTRRDWPSVGATFHDDAIWSVGGAFNLEYRTRANIQAGLRAGVSTFEFLVQMTHSVVIELDGDHAASRTLINEIGRNSAQKSGLFLLGFYTDALSRRDGCWAFDRRHFEPLYVDAASLGGVATLA
jgi:hypothetical protein